MNIKDIEVVLSDPGIPTETKTLILNKAKAKLREEFEVEVVVELRAITLDVYDNGVLIEREVKPYRSAEEVKILVGG